jgi:two-component system osmolarity sensor histidine kinase EnvZ
MFSILNSIHKNLFPKSLLTRFMLIIIVPVLISQLLAVYLFYKRHWYNVSQNTSYLIATEISELIRNLNSKKIPKQGNYLNLEYSSVSSKLPDHPQEKYVEELEIFKKLLQEELGQEGVIVLDQGRNVHLYLQIGAQTLLIKLPYKAILNPTTSIFVLWIIFLTILLLSISLIFSKNQIKSIIELTDTAESYGRGEKTDKYKPSGAKEIRQAGLAFLKMRDRIERQTAKRTQMLAMISHDLKTPLTRMKLQAELMNESEEKEELQYDIDSMQHMIDSYLDFARGEGGEDFKPINLNNWISSYIKTKWSENNISLNISPDQVITLIKPHSFERAIANLVGNAFKHSSKVKISLSSSEDEALIIIEDNGKGIKKDERKSVFKPFYRADKSRSLDNSAGVGLGLAITKEIISGHYGTITLGESKSLKGLLVQIQLPIKK